ncbi:hypothetical protein INS49_011372 [Diaporthe citri]|uniref:uncharacterized protein n=1 Tax=Diaporthe citri TaxID=83186 RepID=UPI001C8230D3|nr:uncharacterized protein INS49_011372 [Diaporthe citri]KAG6360315.1 hypothetical protein INS49_011372 [Diaporthe citri]
MPPPIEEEEEIDPDEGSSSDQLASDETVLNNADVLIDPSRSVQSRVSPERVVSDIPLVTSDIQPTKVTAPASVSQELSRRETGIKTQITSKEVQLRRGGETEEGQSKSSALRLLRSSTGKRS